jgi:predicted nucleic acid-binding protein
VTKKIYLDTSALVKRYLKEEGTNVVDSFFKDSYENKVVLIISQWNIGEAAVVFDKYQNRKIIRDARKPFEMLYKELSLMVKLGSFKFIPVLGDIIGGSIPLVLSHHIYIADALQIETCKHQMCNLFVAFDEKLNQIAKDEGLAIIT